jgi:hypothetical protein
MKRTPSTNKSIQTLSTNNQKQSKSHEQVGRSEMRCNILSINNQKAIKEPSTTFNSDRRKQTNNNRKISKQLKTINNNPNARKSNPTTMKHNQATTIK